MKAIHPYLAGCAYDAVLRFCESVLPRCPTNETSGCWEFSGSRSGAGYGVFKVGRKNTYAHRASYEFFVGPLKEGQVACHTCDNPICCNPTHIFAGTQSENLQDSVRKNRFNAPFGRGALFNSESVLQILRRALEGESQSSIARDLNTTSSCIHGIISGKAYKKEQRDFCAVHGPIIVVNPRKSVLVPRQVARIRELLAEGVSVKEVASQFTVSENAIRDIKNRVSWRSI